MSQRVSSRRFIDEMSARGFGPYAGVPCSFLRPFIDYVIDRDDLEYVAATNEGEALAFAAGAQLAGRRPVVMLQNSGLGNMVNPLASLTYTFRIPVLIIVTLRGEPGLMDEPQHELMGRVTGGLLSTLAVEHEWFPASDDGIAPALDRAVAHMDTTGLPFAFILRKNVVDEYTPRPRTPATAGTRGVVLAGQADGPMPSRRTAISLLADLAGNDTAIVATTGKTGRELFEHCDRPTHLYVVGSMGCASSIGLGIATQTDAPVLVLDGDGAALMRLEAMASIGHLAPPHFVHVILDNQAHESTGGQATISASVHFAEIAAACGYATTCSVTGTEALAEAFTRARAADGPHLIHTRVAIETDAGLGRPSVHPPDVAARFRSALAALRVPSPAGA
jgi:phosphonopyruvate decarboxylase